MIPPLSGRFAIITGGTRGIGNAIATRLRADGARVLITSTKPDATLAADWEHYAVDFADARALDSFASYIATLKPDILVNNAGINRIAPFADIDPRDFLRIQQVNVVAPFRLCQAVIPAMKERRWGRIVTISSIWGKISRAQRASYSASKFAVDGMTAALAAEVAEFNVLANCVAPGFIDTELTRRVLGEAGAKAVADSVPCKRLGTPQEVAALVAWLVGPENTYVSGQNILIDGGFTRV